MIDPQEVRANLARARERIAAAGGDPSSTEIVAVTKGFGPDAPEAALQAGLASLGENYAQELADKAADVVVPAGAPAPRWHFIGGLQSNKVRLIAPLVDCWQSVDRSSLIKEIARRAPGAEIFVQVNAAGEAHKSGCGPDDVPRLVDEARAAGLRVTGLMTIGVDGDEPATSLAFERVRDIADALGLPQRSMGMSGDLELAVAAGTTMVRIGTALFGPRPAKGSR